MVMCDCLNQLRDRLKEQFSKEAPKGKIEEADFQNSAFIERGNRMPLELISRYVIKYTTLSSKGKELKRKKEYNICYKYCPFCGKKLEESDGD